ncbi:MAG TPA: dihydrofolate reductase family protein [Chloroflexota bacterium]|nr:dihydrofolate reductase family protein [Chloroflexota bacterium]
MRSGRGGVKRGETLGRQSAAFATAENDSGYRLLESRFSLPPERTPNAHTYQSFRHSGRQGLRAGRSACPAAALRVQRRRLLWPAGVPCELRGGCNGPHNVPPGTRCTAWPWKQPVFVLTSSALPEGTPSDVTSAPTAAELVKLMESAGIGGDVHLVGGPSTMQAFRNIDALAEVWLHVVPMILGSGHPLAPAGAEPLSLTLQSTRTFPDGVVELGYTLQPLATALKA